MHNYTQNVGGADNYNSYKEFIMHHCNQIIPNTFPCYYTIPTVKNAHNDLYEDPVLMRELKNLLQQLFLIIIISHC